MTNYDAYNYNCQVSGFDSESATCCGEKRDVMSCDMCEGKVHAVMTVEYELTLE